MKKKRFLTSLVAGLSIMAFVGCGGAKTEQPPAETPPAATENAPSSETASEADSAAKKELKKISVSEPVRGVLWGPVYLAKQLGYFEENGLDVEFITVQGDMPTAPVMSGDAQFGLYGPEMILKFNDQGQGTKLLLSTTTKYPYSFVSAPDIKEVSQLKGTTINGADSGSSPRAFVRSVVASAGLNADSDVSYVNVPNSGLIAALKNGDVQGSYVSPTARALALEGGNHLLIDMYDPAVHEKILESPTYEMYITFATDKYIAENPEDVQAFVSAVYKSIQWANEHSSDEIIEKLKPMFADDPTFDATVKEIKDNNIWSENGQFTDSGYAAINKMAISSGLIKAPLDKTKAINDSFILKAAE